MKTNKETQTQISRNETYSAEPLLVKIRRMAETNEPIAAETTRIYTDKKMGVMAAYDIRADKFDIAMAAQDKYQAAMTAKGVGTPDVAVEESQEVVRKGRIDASEKAEPSGGLTE